MLADQTALELLQRLKQLRWTLRVESNKSVEPPPVAVVAEKMLPPADASPEERVTAYEAFREYLFAAGEKAFSGSNKGHCHVHGKECHLWQAIAETDIKKRKKMLVGMAGTSCTDFSKRRSGSIPGLAGKTTQPFYIFCSELNVLEPDVVYFENVANFPAALLREILPQYSLRFITVNPVDYGFPVSRPRIFGILTHKLSTIFEGSMAAFEQTFKRVLKLSGDIFWTAPAADVLHAYEDRARGRCNVLRKGESRADWDAQKFLDILQLPHVISPAMYNRLQEYKNMRSQRNLGGEEAFIIDLDQNPGYSQCGAVLPSVPRHFALFSCKHERLLTGLEALSAFGENIYCQSVAPPS